MSMLKMESMKLLLLQPLKGPIKILLVCGLKTAQRSTSVGQKETMMHFMQPLLTGLVKWYSIYQIDVRIQTQRVRSTAVRSR